MSSSDFDDELRGALFVNHDHKPGDKRPSMKGYVIVGGNRLEMAAWTRTIQQGERSGEKMMSVKLEFPKKANGGTAPTQAQPVQAAPVVQPTPDEDIPF